MLKAVIAYLNIYHCLFIINALCLNKMAKYSTIREGMFFFNFFFFSASCPIRFARVYAKSMLNFYLYQLLDTCVYNN